MEKLSGENIRDHILVKRIFTHRDFSDRYNAYKGTALGLAHTLKQTAIFQSFGHARNVAVMAVEDTIWPQHPIPSFQVGHDGVIGVLAINKYHVGDARVHDASRRRGIGTHKTHAYVLPEKAQAFGQILESFVAMEVRKQTGWSRANPKLFHYRTHGGREVDLVLEDRSGRVVCFEVKSTTSLKSDVADGIRDLADSCGERFIRGIILYLGDSIVPLDRNIHAVPLGALWNS